MKRKLLLAILFLTCLGNASTGLKQGTRIVLQDNKVRRVENVCLKQNILSYCGPVYGTYLTPLEYVTNSASRFEILIETEFGGTIAVTPSQEFYDIKTSSYVKAKDLTLHNVLMDKDENPVKIKRLLKTKAKRDSKYYYLSLMEPNTFFILDSSGHSVLCHNIILECLLLAEGVAEVVGWFMVGAAVTGAVIQEINGAETYNQRMSREEFIEKVNPVNLRDDNVYRRGSDKELDDILDKIDKANLEDFIDAATPNGPNDPDSIFEKFKKFLANKNVLPHAFRKDKGHVPHMTEKMLDEFIKTIDPKNLKNAAFYNDGKVKIEMFKRIWPGVGQVWTRTKNGKIDDAGINLFKAAKEILEKIPKAKK